ncbi:hypothetical protein C0993_008061 [Termitomyces sp. T159_Od127]|nr:hypothetical protein C0993_008061 [Termitomyces sp. T159_Od127]
MASAVTTRDMTLRPLIAICGTTGVGKSNFAIELARHLGRGARIINADSMQVYRGLDVITNKVPEEERQGVEHVLMGFKAPGEQYVVGQWVQDALKEVDETHKRTLVPIVVGGTSYWMQHLIFPNRLSNAQAPPVRSTQLAGTIASLRPDLLVLFDALPDHPPSATEDPDAAYKLHSLLSALDPVVANRWHWKDTRKVLRSLNVIKETGRRVSDIMLEQTQDPAASKPRSVALGFLVEIFLSADRFRTLCFWLHAEQPVLETRLDERVDTMIERGLLSEIREMRQIATSADNGDDYTLGIYQSIGYKEFHDYLSAPDPSETMFDAAVEHMKLSTRQYAKRQVSWIRNKLLPAVYTANAKESLVPTYLLDATGKCPLTCTHALITPDFQVLGEDWNKNVRDLGIQIAQDFLAGGDLPDPLALSDNAKKMMTIEKKFAE